MKTIATKNQNLENAIAAAKRSVAGKNGSAVADAYEDGRLENHSTCLHVIVALLDLIDTLSVKE